MNKKLNFTKAALLQAPLPPKGKVDYYKDLREAGLEMIVSSGGAKTFYLYRKINGKPERVKLGKFPDMSVENARKAAQRNKGLIADGINPNEEKRRIRDEHTFKELFDEYMERYSKVHKRSWKYDEREVNKHLAHWFKRKISAITQDEVSRLHAKIGKESGIYQANRILERTRSIFNKAIEWGWRGVNPANGIKKFKEKSRDRFLNAEEMPRFFKALEMEENETARDFFKVLLLTGVRKSNALTMRWEQICFKERTWRIPETKNGDPLTVPLNEHVVNLLKDRLKEALKDQMASNATAKGLKHDLKEELKAETNIVSIQNDLNERLNAILKGDGSLDLKDAAKLNLAAAYLSKSKNPWVFKGDGKAGHLNDPKKAWARVLKAAEIEDLRMHDLRRTFGSWQAALGANSYIIGKSLGHKSQQATAIYARLNLDPVRESTDRAIEAMLLKAEETTA